MDESVGSRLGDTGHIVVLGDWLTYASPCGYAANTPHAALLCAPLQQMGLVCDGKVNYTHGAKRELERTILASA